MFGRIELEHNLDETRGASMNESILLNSIISYIEDSKGCELTKTDPLIDIVLDYCNKYSISEEEIGYIISEDKQLKDLLEYDCIKTKYLNVASDNDNSISLDSLEDW